MFVRMALRAQSYTDLGSRLLDFVLKPFVVLKVYYVFRLWIHLVLILAVILNTLPSVSNEAKFVLS